jgi:hypothetical protein
MTVDIDEMAVADRLREADKSWSVQVISEAIMYILRQNPGMTMLDIEDHFRTLDSKTTYLVAWPKNKIPAHLTPRNAVTFEPVDYALWVCINGPQDMIDTLAAFGLTREKNREALAVTGFNMIDG